MNVAFQRGEGSIYKVDYGGGNKPRSKKFRRLWLAEAFARENGPSVIWLDQGEAVAAPDRYVPVRRFPGLSTQLALVAEAELPANPAPKEGEGGARRAGLEAAK